MSENSKDKNFFKQNEKMNEISLNEILHIINRRKIVIFISTISILLIVFLYNTITKPIYEASVLLKKEQLSDSRRPDEIQNIVAIQTFDELETEIEIIKSRSVIGNVVEELNLYFIIKKVIIPEVGGIKINSPYYNYFNNFLQKRLDNNKFPRFTSFNIDSGFSGEFKIKILNNKKCLMEDIKTGDKIETPLYSSNYNFTTPLLNISILWQEVKSGSKIYFKILNRNKAIESLRKSISIQRIGETNIFKVSAKSSSPFMAQMLADLVAKKFREIRIEQKKQTIRYSFNFIDNQLHDVSIKLKNVEDSLSSFKSQNKIITIDKSSSDIIGFISELESERVRTNLQLAEHQNKLTAMNAELKNKGYFDQTYLTPTGSEGYRSPFSTLLEELSDAELRRIELLQRRTKNHPDVVAIDEKISEIKDKLSKYNQNTITAYQIIINSLKKKKRDLSQLISKYSRKLGKLPVQETQLAKLLREKNVYEKMFNLLLDKREEMRMAELSKLQDIIIVDSAELPYRPISPRKTLNLIIGLFLGLLIGIFTIFILEFNNKKLINLEEIEINYNLPILSIIPQYNRELKKKISQADKIENRLVILMSEKHEFKESYRLLRIKLSNYYNNDNKIFLFTSCEEDTGKTTVVSNLGLSLSQAGKRVLVIDCDLKKSNVAKFFNISGDYPGLIDYLTNKVNIPYIYTPFENDISNLTLDIVPAGGFVENSSELLGSIKMKNLIEISYPVYDYILLDTPPITKIVDALVLGEFVKDVILIVRPNHTFKDSISLGIQELEEFKMKLLGVVVNACDLQKSSYKYKYGYGYGYGYYHSKKVNLKS